MSIFKQNSEIYDILHQQKYIRAIYREGKSIYKNIGLTTQTKALILATFGETEGKKVFGQAVTYAIEHPNIVPFINEDPLLVCSLVETSKTRWLVGDGVAWILTNVEVRNTIGFNAYAVSHRIGTNTLVYGGNASGRLGISYYDGENKYVLHYNSTYHIKNNYPAQSVPHLFSYNVQNGKFLIDGQQYDSWTWSSNPSGAKFGIFAANTGAEKSFADIQFVEFVDNQPNDQVAHFVPCQHDNQAGMLDIISCQFYPNANAIGQFTIQLTDKEK
jgi:hypothetical protein